MAFNYYDAISAAQLTGGNIITESAAASKQMRFGAVASGIYLTTNNKVAIDTGGSFDHYAHIHDYITDIPMTSANRVINVARLTTLLKKYDYRID